MLLMKSQPAEKMPVMNLRNALKIAEGDGDDALVDLLDIPEEKRGPNDLLVYPEKMWDSFTPIKYQPVGVDYLLNDRSLTLNELVEYDFRWDGLKRRVCVPIRGRDKKLYGIRGRAVDKTNELRYWSYPLVGITNPQVWYGEDTFDPEEPILVTESVFGRIFARRFYKNTVAPLSAGISSAQIQRIQDGFLFVHLFDADKAGKRASLFLRSSLPKAKHVVLEMPAGEDPDSLVRKYGMQALQQIIGEVLPVIA